MTQDFGDKVAKIRTAQKAFGEDKESAFEAKVRRLRCSLGEQRADALGKQMVDDQIKLLALQQTLEQESLGKSFVGLSINETIRACLVGSSRSAPTRSAATSRCPTSGAPLSIHF